MRKHIKTILSCLLIIAIVISDLPYVAKASSEVSPEVTETTTEAPLSSDEVTIVSELVEKREPNMKHFRLSDGTITAAVYPYDVHYTDSNGRLQDIDNTLKSSKDGQDATFENKQNETNVEFMKKSNKNRLFTLGKGKHKIEVAIEGVSKVNSVISENTETSHTGNPYKLNGLSGQITYPEIFANTDIQYTVVAKELKENIILKSKVDFNNITYQYKFNNDMDAIQLDEQTVVFREKDSDKVFFEISAPIMWDATGEHYDNLKLSLKETKNGKATIELSWDFATLKNMTYPVTIDPVMSFSTNRLEIQDTHVLAGYPTTNYNATNHIRVRNNGYALLQFPTPSLSTGDKIIHAELMLYPYGNFDNSLSIYTNENSYNPPLYINAHKILKSWNEKTATYQNVAPDNGFYESTVQSHRIVDGDDSFYTWDITRLANEWTEGYATNYGVLLKYDQPPSDGSTFDSFFCSTNGAYIDSAAWPQILYQYVNTNGLENYLSYHSQDIGYAGTAHVNDLTGHITLVNPLVQTGGNLMPISVSLVYNSDSYTVETYGRCWNLNWSQKIEKVVSSTFNGVKYCDGDGTTHYFKYDSTKGVYVDEINSNRILTLNSSTGKFKMTDSSGSVLYFSRNGSLDEWFLTKSEDAYGNYIDVELDSTYMYRVKKLRSSTGNVIDFIYRDYGFLSKIQYYNDDGVAKTITVDYNNYGTRGNNCIGKIIFPDDTYVQYHYYDGTYNLLKVVDIDGYNIRYGYTNGTPTRVNSVAEYGNDNTLGQQMTMSYEPTATYITDVTNSREYLYTFEVTGTLKSVVDITSNDGNGYGQYYEYNNGNTTELKGKDQLTFISKTQKSTVNKQRDHSFEKDLNLWSYQAWKQTAGTSSASLSSTRGYLGTKSYQLYRSPDCNATRVLAYDRINIVLGKKYTLSAYVNTRDMTSLGKGASVYVVGEYFEFDSEQITETKDQWQRVSVTFIAPITGAASICFSMQESYGYAYFDCVQIEEGDLSEYNLLENAGFEGPYGTTAEGWGSYTGENFLATNEHASGNYAIRFDGGPNKDNEYQQVIYTTGNAGDTYVASAFAKADSVPATDWQFTLMVRFVQWGTYVNTVLIPFNSYTTDWQKVSGVAKAEGAYTAIVVYLLYCANANDVYFDNVQLIKDTYGTSYTYDENGNIISTIDLQGKSDYSFHYDGNNQLIRQTNISGGRIDYSYNKDIPTQLSLASSGGVSAIYDYDSKGNAIASTTVGSELIAGKHYYIKSMAYSKFLDLANGSTSQGTLIKYDTLESSGHQRWKLVQNADGTYGLSPEIAPSMFLGAEKSTLSDNVKVGLYSNGSVVHQKFNFTKIRGNIYRIDFATTSGYSLDGTESGCCSYYTHSGTFQQFMFILAEDTGSAEHPTITSSATYSDNGEYMKTITDSRGNTTQYEYDESRGYVDFVTTPDGSVTDYSYYANELLKDVSVSKENQTAMASYTYDTAKRLSTITSPSNTVYEFAYDAFSRNTGIKIGTTRSLSSYVYDTKGLLQQLIYGNGTTVEYGYDNLNRQTERSINDIVRYQYSYDGMSRLLEVKDMLGGKKLKYEYDLLDRLASERILNTATNLTEAKLSIRYDDTKNRVSGYDVNIGGRDVSTDYVYGELEKAPDIITGIKHDNTRILSYGYDALNRLQTKTLSTTTPFITEYGYLGGNAVGKTTTLVKTVKNGNDTLEYAYDNMGNIQNVSKNGTLVESYTYDMLGQLKTVTRGSDTYEYSYDNGGNILSVKQNGTVIKNYAYGDSEWKDLLTAYNGTAISYDAIGNPLTYRDGMSFTWTDGRKLSAITKDADSISYTYDTNGLRNSKTVNGTTTEYYWLNGMLQGQKTGEEYIFFLYDENGTAYGFIIQNGTEKSYYYYEFNVQGDIIGIIDSTGSKVVEYTYNEWGKLLSITGTMTDTIGQKNPLRYRGYYYDAETGLYYLNSRYYDPEIGRFINADNQISGVGSDIRGYNLFAYCFNNPVNMNDSTGNWPRWITAVVTVTAVVVGVAALATGNVALAAVAGKVAIAATVTYAVQTAHFDIRANKNKGMEDLTYEQAKNIEGADTDVSDTFHDFSGDNNKVCLQDGREGIYDSSGKYVDDPRDIGTYNCFVPNDFWSSAGHVVVDVIPYLVFGNNDKDPGFIVNFAEKWTNEFIALFE